VEWIEQNINRIRSFFKTAKKLGFYYKKNLRGRCRSASAHQDIEDKIPEARQKSKNFTPHTANHSSSDNRSAGAGKALD